jgi:hypothetical protein
VAGDENQERLANISATPSSGQPPISNYLALSRPPVRSGSRCVWTNSWLNFLQSSAQALEQAGIETRLKADMLRSGYWLTDN